MKTLLVLYDKPDWNHELPYNSKMYNNAHLRKGYESMARAARKEDILFGRASCKWYKGKGLFSKAWIYDKEWKKLRNVKADVVFDKAPSSEKLLPIKKRLKRDIKIYNDPYIDMLCSNKLMTCKTYPNMVPKCFVVHNKKQLKEKLKHIHTDMIVLKPVAGSSAKGLIITNRDKLPKRISRNTLVQEFIDTSGGIPGFVKGISDLRIVVCDGRIITAIIRKAKKGCLASNVSMGGKMTFVPFNKIPKSVRKCVSQIDSKLTRYKSRLYTADFVFDENKKLWLMEMNSKTGLFYYITFGRPDLLRLFNKCVVKSIRRML